jgi:hypothetical protein
MDGHGAALVTKHSIYREDMQRAGILEKYTKEHYNSWVNFAKDTGHGDINPILVTGVDRTRDFAMLCYSKDDDELRCEFTTSAPGRPTWGTWHKTGSVYTTHGPQPRHPPSSVQMASSTFSCTDNHAGPAEDEYNQCVFVRYYTIRKRLGIPRVIKAGAGPHDLGKGDRDCGGSPHKARRESDAGSGADSSLFDPDEECGSPATSESEPDTVIHNPTVVRDPEVNVSEGASKCY